MKVDRDAIAAIRAKIRRAHQHLESLGAEVETFNKSQPYPYRLEAKADPSGAKHVFYLRIGRTFPPEWGVVFGEALHDLRSALDHTVYQLTIDWSGRPLTRSAFPVFTSRARFHKTTRRKSGDRAGRYAFDSGCYLIRGIGPGPQTFIERLQPYPNRRRIEHRALRLVHDRWNQDKHRVIHPTSIEIRRIEFDMQPGCRLAEVNTRTLKKGGKAFVILCDPPKPGLKMHVEAEAKVVIQDPSRIRRGLNESWHGYFVRIGTVIERLLESIGQQAEAIPF